MLNHSLNLIRQGAIGDTIDGSGYLPWPADITPSYTTTASIIGADVNRADTPITDTSYAGNSHTQLAQDNAPSNEWLYASQGTTSSDVDIPTAMNNITSFYRNGTKRYRCQCGSETERIADMKRHLKSGSHLSPQFACICGRMFTRKDGRKSHQKRCHRIEAQDAFLNL